MAWYDELLDYGRKAVDWVSGDSTGAQMARDAGTGLAVHHATGGSGEGNFGAMAGGAALGQGIRYATGGPSFFNNTPAQTASSMQPQVGGNTWSPSSSGNPNAFSTAVSNAAPSATGASFGAGVGDSIASGVETAQTKLDSLKKFGQKNSGALDTGMKGLAFAKNYMDKQKTQGELDRYAQQEDARITSDAATTDATNKARSDVYANQQANIGMAGKNAAAGVGATTARQLAGIDKNTTMSSGAKEAVKRSTAVGGAGLKAAAYTNADMAARSGLQAPTPEYGRSGMRTAGLDATNYRRNNQREDLADLYGMGREMLGINDKATKQAAGGYPNV